MIARKFPDTDEGEAVEMAKSKEGVYHKITVEELEAKWQETVRELAKRGITITNPEHALEGALSIRYNHQCKLFLLPQSRWLVCLITF